FFLFHPFLKGILLIGHHPGKFSFSTTNLPIQKMDYTILLLIRQQHRGYRQGIIPGYLASLLNVVEKAENAVVIFYGNGIKFVIVAACALHGDPEKCNTQGIGPVCYVFHSEFLIYNTTFHVLCMIAIESCSQSLFGGSIGE